MGSWQKFNETSFPEKKEFDSNLKGNVRNF